VTFDNTDVDTYVDRTSKFALRGHSSMIDMDGEYAIMPDRGLRLLNVEPSRGAAPCHLALDPAGRNLFVANYGGTLAAFPIRRDGQIGPAGTVFTNEGTGADRGRQDAPHVHAVGTDRAGRFLHACDLGTDEVLTFRIGEKPGELTLASRVKTPGGVGPRHFVLGQGGRFLYTNNEIRPGVTTFARDPRTGALVAKSTVSSLGPGTWPSGANTAEIVLHPNGRWLYVSNRGAETIALFRIDANGLPVFVEAVPAGVREPRGFTLDPSGRWLVAAGQRSNAIVSLRVDAKTGRLTPTGKSITVGKPVSIVFLAPMSTN
ncbi:lactonase family protein, partial [bacterium]